MAWKKYVQYLPATATILCGFGASCVYTYPHTFGLEKYKDVMTDRSEDSPHNIDEEADLSNQIKKHFKWQDSFRSSDSGLQFIQTKQLLDLSHRGSLSTVWGTVVGFPILFTTSSIQKAQENPVAYLQRYNINVDLHEGQQLLDLFKLSPDAKKFALARELCNAKTIQLYVNFYGINFSFFSCYALGYTLSKFIPFQGAAVISYLTVVPLLGYIYIKAFDYYNCYVQAKSDRTAASISQMVADGGVEYYSKLIASKQALEELQTRDMQRIYKEPDAETRFKFDMSWRKPELSLEERMVRLVQASQKLYH